MVISVGDGVKGKKQAICFHPLLPVEMPVEAIPICVWGGNSLMVYKFSLNIGQ